MPLGLICTIAALLLAFGAGWTMGRSVPSWDIDRQNEDSDRFRRHWGWGGFGGYTDYGYSYGCFSLLASFFQGSGITVVLIVAALAVGFLGYFPLSDSGSQEIDAIPVAGLAISGIAGYVVSRLTDKGPVGPLD